MGSNLAQKVVSEGIGTFALAFIGILAITQGTPEAVGSLVAVALAHGLTIAVMVAALGAISGGHFNPAVTFGFVVTGRMPVGTGMAYWVGQLAGAFLAGALLMTVFGAESVAAGTPQLSSDLSFGGGVVLEAIATFFLVLVIFGSAIDKRAPAGAYPLAIGLTVTLGILAIGPLTGASLNPSRNFGPALASGMWSDHLLYWVGPLLGAAIAAVVMHSFLMKTGDSDEN